MVFKAIKTEQKKNLLLFIAKSPAKKIANDPCISSEHWKSFSNKEKIYQKE